MQIRLTPEQETLLAQIASHEGTTAEILMKAAAMRLLKDDAGFLAVMEEGLTKSNGKELISAEDVRTNVDRILRS